MIPFLRSRLVQAGTMLLVLVVLLAGCLGPRRPPTDSTGTTNLNPVSALGRLRPLNGVILITAPPGDQVEKVWHPKEKNGWEDWSIQKGENLVVLRSQKIRQKEVESAKVQLASAKKQLQALDDSEKAQVNEAKVNSAGLLADAGSEIASLEAKMPLLKERYQSAQDELSRLTDLTPGTVAQQDINKQRLAVQSAQVDVQTAENMLAKAKAGRKRIEPETEAKIVAIKKSMERARTQVPIKSSKLNLELAELRYKDGLIVSPITGEVINVEVHEGDTTGSGPLMRLGNLKDLIVIAEVDESDVLRVHKNERALVKSNVLKKSLDIEEIVGKVLEVGQSIAPNRLSGLNPASFSDRRVVDVKILLDLDKATDDQKKLSEDQKKGLRRMIGLQVDVFIDAKPEEK